MRVKMLLLLCLSILAAVPAFAQTKSVTNADLEKFRQKRLQAEKEYRENYAKMGFPSPEELEKQIEKSRVQREELAERLTAERLQREQVDAERAETDRYNEQIEYFNSDNSIFSNPGYYPGYPTIYYGRRFPRHRPRYNKYPVFVGTRNPVGNYYTYPAVRPFHPGSRWRWR